MAPGVAALRFLALVALDGVALAGVGVSGVAKLDEDGLALARARDWRGEEAVRAVGNGGLHRLADDLGDEHARAQSVARLDRDPLQAVVRDVLGIAERTRGGLEWDERHARDVAFLGLGLDDAELRRQGPGRHSP